jgi:V8-like Glu-specific endopeptidase
MWKRIVAIGGTAVLLAAVVGHAAFASGGGRSKTAAVSAPAGPPATAIVNRDAKTARSYWTPARLAAAKPIDQVRTGPVPDSFGTAVLDFTRSRITPQTANKSAPYKGVGKLFFTEPGVGDFQCSASIISQRLVVTAGHCMYGSGHYFTNWQFIPGYDGSQGTLAKQRPYGTWSWQSAVVPTNYQTTSGTVVNDYDFGIIQFADQTFSGKLKTLRAKVGFNFQTVTGHTFDTAVTMLGYPCNLDSCNIMQRVDSSDHRGSGVASGTNGDTAYEYGSDMGGGSSGGPWVENFGNPASAAPTGGFATRNAIVGVTSYGYTDPNVRVQGASQFNGDFSSILTMMCNLNPGNC